MLRKLFKSFRRNEKAQGLVEYGLILALVSVVAIGSVGNVGDKIKGVFTNTSDGILNVGNVPNEPEVPSVPVVTTEEKVVTDFIPYETVESSKRDFSKFTDEFGIYTKGKNGEMKRVYKLTFKDGVQIDKELISEEVIAEPVTEVVKNGSMDPTYRGYLAENSEFSGESDGKFKYIGNKKTVYVPHEINGVPITSYDGMFSDTYVEKVISDNKNIKSMNDMFNRSKAASLDVQLLNTDAVTSMSHMFDSALAKRIEFGNFNTNLVVDMSWMFQESNVTNLDLKSFDISNVGRITDNSFGFFGMFQSAKSISYDLSSWDVSQFADGSIQVGAMFSTDIKSTVYTKSQNDFNWFNRNVGLKNVTLKVK